MHPAAKRTNADGSIRDIFPSGQHGSWLARPPSYLSVLKVD